jgi:serine phosphatase RsbU (regulator of sigma subunit)
VTELLRAPLGPDGDLVMVRATVRQATSLLGLGEQDQTRLATAAAEAARSTCSPGGGTMRLFVADDGAGGSLLCVGFTPAPGCPAPHPDERVEVLERLLDRFDTTREGWVLGKRLPVGPPPSPEVLDVVRRSLVADADIDPVVVLHEQNSELASTLAQLRSREAELVRLNDELVETNRGVLALYSELERSAEQIRVAQRRVFTELENALRPPPPTLPGVELAIRYLPAQSNSPTGGDLYDWLVLPDGCLHVSVVDVVGHGVASTRAALDVTHALRTLSREGHSLADIVARADALLGDGASLATVLLARLALDTGAVELAAGGHPPALLVRADGSADYVEAAGRPIGVPGAGSRTTARVQLCPGDTLVLYTDGLVEAGPDIDEGFATVRAAARRRADRPLDELLDGVLDTVRAEATLRDDTLLLGVRLGPAEGDA